MTAGRRYSWPEGHWSWPVAVTHKHGVRAGDMIWTGGQVDLDSRGNVRNAGDLAAQCDGAMAYLRRVLADLDSGFDDLIRLVVFFTGTAEDERALLARIAGIIGEAPRPVINMICLPALAYPGMRIEIEGVARTGPKTRLRLPELVPLPEAFSHVIRAGELILTGDISAEGPGGVAHPGEVQAQTRVMMDRLAAALAGAGAGLDDVQKLNVFYAGKGTAEDWEVPARIRAGYFTAPGPTPTGMPLPRFADPDVMTRIHVTAMRGPDGAPLPMRHAWPEGHWDWTAPLPYSHGVACGGLIHVGGQVSLDAQARVIDPGDMIAQTHRAMDNVAAVLAEFGATLEDVVKVTTFYQGAASAGVLHDNFLIRSARYRDPGPASTGVPMPALVYEDMVIEIEVIAMLERQVGLP